MTGNTAPRTDRAETAPPRAAGSGGSSMRRCGRRQCLWEPSAAMDSALSATPSPTPSGQTGAKICGKGSRLMRGLNSTLWPGCVRSPAGAAAPQRLNISYRRCPSGSLKKMLRLLPGRSLTATPRLSSSAFKLS
jgi:hypothetical protein